MLCIFCGYFTRLWPYNSVDIDIILTFVSFDWAACHRSRRATKLLPLLLILLQAFLRQEIVARAHKFVDHYQLAINGPPPRHLTTFGNALAAAQECQPRHTAWPASFGYTCPRLQVMEAQLASEGAAWNGGKVESPRLTSFAPSASRRPCLFPLLSPRHLIAIY